MTGAVAGVCAEMALVVLECREDRATEGQDGGTKDEHRNHFMQPRLRFDRF